MKHYFIRSIHETDFTKPSHECNSIQFEEMGSRETILVNIRMEGKDIAILIPFKELKQAIEWLDKD